MLLKNILYSYYDTQCLYTITKLNIAEHLQSGPKTIVELATQTQVNEDKLYRIMRYMAAKNLFDELPNKTFRINKESRYLLSETPGNLKDLINFHGNYFYHSASELLESITSNDNPFKIKFGKPVWSYFEDNPKAGELFNKAMRELSEYYGEKIADIYDFSPYKTIVDLGGGLGSLLANILLKNKSLNGINFDLPTMEKAAQKYFEEKGIASRCRYMSGDFFETIPENADLYILKAVIHGKNDDQAITLLKHCRKVLPPKSKLLLIDRVIQEGENYLDGCISDIHMLCVSQGTERTLSEFEHLLNQAAFSISNTFSLQGDSLTIIEAQATKSVLM